MAARILVDSERRNVAIVIVKDLNREMEETRIAWSGVSIDGQGPGTPLDDGD